MQVPAGFEAVLLHGVGAIVAVLHSDDAAVRAAALEMLVGLAHESEDARNAIGRAGGAAPLVKLAIAVGSDLSSRVAATRILCALRPEEPPAVLDLRLRSRARLPYAGLPCVSCRA